jgi:ABC-type nickel/cobalt efflux system permease component RcnA
VTFALLMAFAVASVSRADTVASLLGNFTINQFCAVTLARQSVGVHYTVVYGQLPALGELHAADADGDGVTTQTERDAHVETLAPGFADGLGLFVDGVRVPLRATRWTSSLPVEQGGFSLRVDVDFAAVLPPLGGAGSHTLRFTNGNFGGRMGWHEIVVTPAAGVAVFDTDAYGNSATNGLTDALQALPDAGPLDERSVHMSFDESGIPRAVAAGGIPLGPRPPSGLPTLKPSVTATADGASAGALSSSALAVTDAVWISRKTRELIGSLSGRQLDLRMASWALLAALLLGAVHALSPGHGKTIVGAYLIGSRGTPRHALFLGFTVTVTHTIGVFVLGFATLYASRFIVPERLFPILSLASALLVLGMGLVLLVQRGRAARQALKFGARSRAPVFFPVEMAGHNPHGLVLRRRQALDFPAHVHANAPAHAHAHAHAHADGMLHSHGGAALHSHADGTLHSHGGGRPHSHLPPGAAGERITWKSLLTLGISGGLVPCPSALVLLLAAIALNKTAFGMLLVVAFSVGLALTLTIVGLAFLYARNRFRRLGSARPAEVRWPHLLPVLSAGTITVVGIALCVGALRSFN